MNKTDRTVTFQICLTIAVLVAIAVFIGYLSSSFTAGAVEKVKGTITDQDLLDREAKNRILPVGHVVTQKMLDEGYEYPDASVPEVVAVKRTGAEVVDYLCASCHTAGVGGAPKLDDAADWGTRYAQGMDALMAIGINGKEGTTMMPRGGDSSLSDDDIWNSIVAMLKQAGVSISESERVAAEASDSAGADADDSSNEGTEETVAEPVAEAAAAISSKASDVVETMLNEDDNKMKTMATTAADMIVDTTTIPVEPVVEAVNQ